VLTLLDFKSGESGNTILHIIAVSYQIKTAHGQASDEGKFNHPDPRFLDGAC
jgi:hypothetical protein